MRRMAILTQVRPKLIVPCIVAVALLFGDCNVSAAVNSREYKLIEFVETKVPPVAAKLKCTFFLEEKAVGAPHGKWWPCEVSSSHEKDGQVLIKIGEAITVTKGDREVSPIGTIAKRVKELEWLKDAEMQASLQSYLKPIIEKVDDKNNKSVSIGGNDKHVGDMLAVSKEIMFKYAGKRPTEDNACAVLALNIQGLDQISRGNKLHAALVLVEEKRLSTHTGKGLDVTPAKSLHYMFTYPPSCVTIPHTRGHEDELPAKVVRDIAYIVNTTKNLVYVYLLGFADKKEIGADRTLSEREKEYNLVVSRERIIGWELLISKHLTDDQLKRIKFKPYWFGQEFHHHLAHEQKIQPHSAYYSLDIPETFRYLSYNRRAEIIVSLEENPPPVAGWKKAWLNNKNAWNIKKDTLDDYRKSINKEPSVKPLRIIMVDHNFPGQLAEIESKFIEVALDMVAK